MTTETRIAKESKEGLDVRNLIETIPALVVCALPDGSVEFANRAWQEYTGLAAEQLSGLGWQTTIHAVDAPALIDEWNAALASGKPITTEARLRRSDGNYRWFQIRRTLAITPTQNNGLSLRTLIACEDIDDRKRTQVRLQQTEKQLSAFFGNTPNLIFMKDRQGRYLYANKQFTKAFGLSEAQVNGKRDDELFSAEQAASFRANDAQVTDSGIPMEFEEVALQEDGQHTSIVQKFPLFDPEGEIYALGGIVTDITERKREEVARRYTEESYRLVVETANDGVVSMDESGSIVFANAATTRIFGYEPKELVGKQLTLLMPEFMRQLHESGFKGYLTTGRRHINWQGAEFSALRKNGEEFPVEVSFGELTRDGQRVFTGFIRDITARKRDERERERLKDELRQERDRLRLLLEITNSMTSKLDLPRLIEALSTNLLSVTRCDFCALLLPNADSGQLRMTILYNPEARGSLCEGTLVPIRGSSCDKAFRTGKTQHFHSYEEVRDDPEYFGSSVGRPFYQRVMAEGLVSGCDLPLIGRDGVVGVLAALKRSERAFGVDEVAFLEQVAGQVAIAVENALDYEKAIKERDKETKQRLYLEEEIRAEIGEIVGDSPALKTALDLISVVAPTDSSVLILGETGTGKELVARALHKLSARRERAFVKLNCAAIPLGLLESELFGHERGAFTGAIAQKTGRFELANKGTLFLDEVGDIPLELQAKLLRVLQEQEFERLGSNRTHKVDVRLVAATHRDLLAMAKQGTFREDLYYRLRVFPIHVPTLRQRTEDIPKLVWHFTALSARRMNKKIDEIPPETMDALVRYHWPGNVRELQNFIERAVILSPHFALRAPISELEPFHAHKELPSQITGLAEVERDHILLALEASNWVIGGRNGAADRLGMKRTSLVYRMKKLRISRPRASAGQSMGNHSAA